MVLVLITVSPQVCISWCQKQQTVECILSKSHTLWYMANATIKHKTNCTQVSNPVTLDYNTFSASTVFSKNKNINVNFWYWHLVIWVGISLSHKISKEHLPNIATWLLAPRKLPPPLPEDGVFCPLCTEKLAAWPQSPRGSNPRITLGQMQSKSNNQN